MSAAPSPAEAAPPAGGDSFFRLRSGSPLVAILVSLALVTLAALGVALALRSEQDIQPFTPDAERVLPSFGRAPSPALAVAVARSLGQRQPPTPPTGTPVVTPPTADPIGGDAADRVRLPGGISVELPEAWSVRASDESSAYLDDRDGGWFAMRVVEWERTQPGADLLAEELGRLLPGDTTARLETSGIETFVPFGDLVSWAAVGYSAVRMDSQGGVAVAGSVYAFVRQDGLALVVASERTPPDDWEDEIAAWAGLLETAASGFAKAPL